MACKTLQGKYAEKLEIENKKLKEEIETYKFTIRTQFQQIQELINKLDRRDEYEFLEQKNKK